MFVFNRLFEKSKSYVNYLGTNTLTINKLVDTCQRVNTRDLPFSFKIQVRKKLKTKEYKYCLVFTEIYNLWY